MKIEWPSSASIGPDHRLGANGEWRRMIGHTGQLVLATGNRPQIFLALHQWIVQPFADASISAECKRHASGGSKLGVLNGLAVSSRNAASAGGRTRRQRFTLGKNGATLRASSN